MGLKRLVNGLKYVIFFLFCVKTYLEKKSVMPGKPGNIREFHLT